MTEKSTEPRIVTAIDVEALAREIAFRMAPDALLDAADVGALLKVSAYEITHRYVTAPGFPKPIRLTRPDGKVGRPRWQRADIVAWINSHKDGAVKRGGRPRKAVEW